ncbi:ketoacyl-ACP synthase III [Frigoribacterium sp. CFBP 13712]|uniref:ketoacyl-ACP synthase III n=1 Tax=Frigoribacterium sp. CFBP 13712 TaxID=2775309 RepID=UPI00177C11D1|nr:ketoacyl-ACP synthase III [Frigoribacterium sp. CFBP 13712]MBD8704714.1 ketoacyl-ACP synthase III [Frigoribacterium sp. CFBP 13712]
MSTTRASSAPFRYAALGPVASFVPPRVVDNDELNREFAPENIDRLAAKTGIVSRHVVDGETSSDLAVGAAERLFREHGVDRDDVDFLLLCTQSPDFTMPSTSSLVQHRLGLRNHVGALDLTVGCSGYVYALGVAKGLIESGQARTILLVTVDTISRFINPADRQLRSLFGDGASASLVTASAEAPALTGFAYGTDGSGVEHLIVPGGGFADPSVLAPKSLPEARGLVPSGRDLYMNGAEVFTFSLRVVPEVVDRSLELAGVTMDDIDVFVLHQANAFMLETLRKKLGIDPTRFVVAMHDVGNTTSSSIPLALEAGLASGQVSRGQKAVFVGFGVGLSWAAVVVDL